jgi:hypothetical protein
VHRVFETDVVRRELVDDVGVVLGAPELREPAADDGLVVLCGHVCTSCDGVGGERCRERVGVGYIPLNACRPSCVRSRHRALDPSDGGDVEYASR